MNTENEDVALPGDFADRVLREVDRRRARTHRTRNLGAGLAIAVVLAAGLPMRLAHVLRPRHPAATAMVGSDDGLTADESELDPGSFFGTEVMVAVADEESEGDW